MRRRLAENCGNEVRRFEGMTSEQWGAERARHWDEALSRLLELTGIEIDRLGQRTTEPEKMQLAYLLKTFTDASNGWVASKLSMGKPATVSQNMRRYRIAKGPEEPEMVAILSRIKQCPL